MIIKERIKKNYFELRKLFLANDPEGRGNVTRDALARIVISFVGKFVSLKQFNMLMNRYVNKLSYTVLVLCASFV